MAWQYSEKTTQLFMDAVHGKPGTHMGEVEDADGVGEHGSIACGDALKFTFRVEKHDSDPMQDKIVECKYLTFGCTSAIAASEALCFLIQQERCTPVEALKITNQDIVDFLGGLPEQKIHCSVMGAEALEAAVADWAEKRSVNLACLGIHPHQEEMEEGRIVCKCFSLSEPYLKRKIKEMGLKTIEEVTDATKAGGACTTCQHGPGGIQDILNETWGLNGDEDEVEAPAEEHLTESLSPYQLGKKIDEAIADSIRPMLQKDGGDIELVDIKEALVYVTLKGACAGCPGAASTLKLMVEKTLKEQVDERIRIIAV
ncbi:MAG: iron-sulfur cluster assembly scaffold protein [Planctomycetota bacterium]|jgi:NifU-like protein